MKRMILSALVTSLLAVTVLGSTALADAPQEVPPEEMLPEILAETETPVVGEVRIIANEGDADLNTICVCIMLGFGAVCGMLAGMELVKKWNL
jgi:hypothetical protein